MPPKKKGGKKGKDKDEGAQQTTEKPKTPEPTEKELLLQKEYVQYFPIIANAQFFHLKCFVDVV